MCNARAKYYHPALDGLKNGGGSWLWERALVYSKMLRLQIQGGGTLDKKYRVRGAWKVMQYDTIACHLQKQHIVCNQKETSQSSTRPSASRDPCKH